MRAALAAVLIALAAAPLAAGGTPPPYTGPLFDAHLHVTPAELLPEELFALVEKAGISEAFLFRPQGPPVTPPAWVHPFSTLPVDPATRELLLNDETVALLDRLLSAHEIQGIGEASLRFDPAALDGGSQGPPRGASPGSAGGRGPGRKGKQPRAYPVDGPVVLRIFDVVARHKAVVSIHADYPWAAEVERGAAHNRSANIIWAHVGDASPALARDVLRRNPNLYADVSCRHPFWKRAVPIAEQSLTDDAGVLKPEWKALLEELPDRFLFGSDVGGPSERHRDLEKIVAYYRSVLGQLSPPTAAKIGYQNARRLLGLPEAGAK